MNSTITLPSISDSGAPVKLYTLYPSTVPVLFGLSRVTSLRKGILT
ncbi:MAG: hypothetical protein LM563_05265 [Thermofilum sp.]|nr:hypothetical protein [Thermofilum sp.]